MSAFFPSECISLGSSTVYGSPCCGGRQQGKQEQNKSHPTMLKSFPPLLTNNCLHFCTLLVGLQGILLLSNKGKNSYKTSGSHLQGLSSLRLHRRASVTRCISQQHTISRSNDNYNGRHSSLMSLSMERSGLPSDTEGSACHFRSQGFTRELRSCLHI